MLSIPWFGASSAETRFSSGAAVFDKKERKKERKANLTLLHLY
jgi:hypothetical protein